MLIRSIFSTVAEMPIELVLGLVSDATVMPDNRGKLIRSERVSQSFPIVDRNRHKHIARSSGVTPRGSAYLGVPVVEFQEICWYQIIRRYRRKVQLRTARHRILRMRLEFHPTR